MLIKELAELIEKIAPIDMAEEWDNVGLLIGNENCVISGVVVCVDLTKNVIKYAINHNCNTIITHHPVIFDPLKKLVSGDYSSDLILACLSNNINIYSSHTNMDMSKEGINYTFAKMLNIKCMPFLHDGLGVYGEFDGDLDKLLLYIKQITNEKTPKVYVNNNKKDCKKQLVAFISGSGGRINEVVTRCKELNITTFISSEFKHNIILELLGIGTNVIEIGHFESEVIFIEIINNLLKNKISNLYKYVNLI